MRPLSIALASAPVVGEVMLLELTRALIDFGARTQVIVALTGLSDKKVRPIIKALTGGELVRGPCQFPNAQFFAGVQRKRNPLANLHSTIFLSEYLKLRECFNEPMHEGFLLSTAFHGYSELVQANPEMKRSDLLLDVNRAYALIRCYDRQELSIVSCACCDAKYLKLNWMERDSINCPICAKTAHRRFLAEVGQKGGRRKSA